MHAGLEALLQHVHTAGGGFEALVRGAQDRNIPVHEVLGHVEFDWYPELVKDGERLLIVLEYEEQPWFEMLSLVLGGDEQAQVALGKASGWMAELTLSQWRGQGRARHALHCSADEPRRPDALRSAVEFAGQFLSQKEVDATLHRVVQRWPVGVLAELRWLPGSLQRAGLLKRGSWPELLDEAEGEVGPALAVNWISRVLGISTTESEPDRAYLLLAAALRNSVGLSMAEPIRRVSQRKEPQVWLDIGRRVGYPPSQAMLIMLDCGLAVGYATIQMSAAGWPDDEIFSALRENAIGPSRALQELHHAGWNASRLVESLRKGGLLDPEIRESLKELGLPVESVAAMMSTALSHE